MMFKTFNGKFFSGCLACVELEWSKKMYQCAGICYSRSNRMGMSITIRLSEPLLKLRSRKDLVETLLHEMIHAWNFVRGVLEENGGHGQNFLAKMHEINRLAGTNISVYHSFRDEVELYKKHWWRCDGACQNRKPFYGFVKRTSNRAPGKNDRWFSEHQNSCGGNFIKVKEPEKESKAKKQPTTTKKRKPTTPPSTPSNGNADIRKFFKPDLDKSMDDSFDNSLPDNMSIVRKVPEIPKLPTGDGSKLGGSGSGRSKLLDMFANVQNQKSGKNTREVGTFGHSSGVSNTKVGGSIDLSIQSPSVSTKKKIRDPIFDEFDDDDDIILIDGEYDDNFPKPIILSPDVVILDDPQTATSSSSASANVKQEKCHCPVCDQEIEIQRINDHLDQCIQIS